MGWEMENRRWRRLLIVAAAGTHRQGYTGPH